MRRIRAVSSSSKRRIPQRIIAALSVDSTTRKRKRISQNPYSRILFPQNFGAKPSALSHTEMPSACAISLRPSGFPWRDSGSSRLTRNTFYPNFCAKPSALSIQRCPLSLCNISSQWDFPEEIRGFPLRLTCVHGSELIPLEFSLLVLCRSKIPLSNIPQDFPGFPLRLTCIHGSEFIPPEFSLLGTFAARPF
ncbi:hypothetical protein CEXT_172721 [Caerostris extrusa]|uniref:Uncharacterized protein n=1 Tax=Caerostris extrusa TaxID=172846 RepID=A0AAV4W3A5_CAEEX|nr:hypothetical protein CEXT_172721 [Caerostris extrusa]